MLYTGHAIHLHDQTINQIIMLKIQDFMDFNQKLGITHKCIVQGHPATNGLAEHNLQTVKSKRMSMNKSQFKTKSEKSFSNTEYSFEVL